MSDYNNNGSGRPQGRGRGGRRRTGPNNRSHTPRDDSGNFRPNRSKKYEPSGWEKFLTIITFGLYKPAQLPNYTKPASASKAPQEPGPIARGDREERQAGRREGGRDRDRDRDRGDRPDRGDRESRPPRQQPISTEVTNERLYVGNLSYDASESDLLELFSGSGNVKNAEVVVNSRTQRSKGFAFVTMMSVEEAKKAVADLNTRDFMGRPLVVGGAKPMAPREERSNYAADPDAITRPVEDDEEEAEKTIA